MHLILIFRTLKNSYFFNKKEWSELIIRLDLLDLYFVLVSILLFPITKDQIEFQFRPFKGFSQRNHFLLTQNKIVKIKQTIGIDISKLTK